jgi:hypothetical protein
MAKKETKFEKIFKVKKGIHRNIKPATYKKLYEDLMEHHGGKLKFIVDIKKTRKKQK